MMAAKGANKKEYAVTYVTGVCFIPEYKVLVWQTGFWAILTKCPNTTLL